MKYIRKLARFQISYTEDVLNSPERERDNIISSYFLCLTAIVCNEWK